MGVTGEPLRQFLEVMDMILCSVLRSQDDGIVPPDDSVGANLRGKLWAYSAVYEAYQSGLSNCKSFCGMNRYMNNDIAFLLQTTYALDGGLF